MDRFQVDRFGRADLSTILPRYITAIPVGHLPDHAQVMRHEEVGSLQLALEVGHQIHDLPLNRNVERRDRFVGDDQAVRAQEARAMPMR